MRFGYIQDKEFRTDVKRALTRFLQWHPSLVYQRVQATAEQANELDRYELAEQFLEYRDNRVEELLEFAKENRIDMNRIIDDLAVYIDLAIPKSVYNTALFMKCQKEKIDFFEQRDHHPYPGIHVMLGFKFQFEENYDREIILQSLIGTK